MIVLVIEKKIQICGIYRAFKIHDGETKLQNFANFIAALENMTTSSNG